MSICPYCKREFDAKPRQIYCGAQCSAKFHAQTQKSRSHSATCSKCGEACYKKSTYCKKCSAIYVGQILKENHVRSENQYVHLKQAARALAKGDADEFDMTVIDMHDDNDQERRFRQHQAAQNILERIGMSDKQMREHVRTVHHVLGKCAGNKILLA